MVCDKSRRSVYGSTMNRWLIRGLRNAKSLEGGDWRELVTMAIQGKWPAPVASPPTLKAESGLGILGKPYYFYVLRAEATFGFVIFVLGEAEGVVWPEDARGATPFDSGGWLEIVSTEPPLDATARQAAFRKLDVPLRDWQNAFEQHIQAQYDTVGDYLKGRAPKSGLPPAEAGFAIIKGKPNKPRAWTWEVRVPHDLIANRLTLKTVYMVESDLDAYVEWLPHSPLADSESRRIQEWIDDHAEVPTQDEDVVAAASASMALEAAHG